MISYTIDEIRAAAKNAAAVEIYKYSNPTHRLHTDFISELDMTIDELKQVDGSVKCDLYMLDEEDYNNTILANCGVQFEDMYNPGDKICVIVLPYWDNDKEV